MAFENRAEAGRLLAGHLEKYRGQHPSVLAIPRGAVPMEKIVADALDGELDVVLVRKLRASYNLELAIGSIDETGAVYLDPETRDLWDEPYLEAEKKTQLVTLHQRRQQYEPAGAVIDAAGRIAIVLDDGIATGSTMIAALRAVRARHPAKLLPPRAWPPRKRCVLSVKRPMKSSVSRRRPSCTRSATTSATFRRCRTKRSSRPFARPDDRVWRPARVRDVDARH